MLHVCVKKFDVTGAVENFLGTKQGLNHLFLWIHLNGLVEPQLVGKS